jgi:tetratricopeptide (TPR) repeat protein
MFATRTMRVEWELAKWFAILAIGAALAMFWAMKTAAATPIEPGLLPVNPAVQPMPTPMDPNVVLWAVLNEHAAGQPDELWGTVDLPQATQQWKLIGIGVAEMQRGNLEAAATYLFAAEELNALNPVTHYYLGLLRLGEARQAKEWYDATGPAVVRFAAYRPHVVAPNTRGMYELVAMQEFEEAIANAANLDRAMMLAMPDHRVQTTATPVTVADVLKALGCENFEGQAHNMLGAMNLDRGAVDAAEEHMDAAHAAGLQVVFGYRDLGAAFETEGRYGDAARAYLKALENDQGKVLPMKKILENFGKALVE